MADHAGDGVERLRRQAGLGQHAVQRGREVRHAVHQRAVEIEDGGAGAALSGRSRPAQRVHAAGPQLRPPRATPSQASLRSRCGERRLSHAAAAPARSSSRRITVGMAAAASASGRASVPSGGASVGTLGGEQRHLQLEMREAVPRHARHALPVQARQRREGERFRLVPGRVAPGRAGQFQHARRAARAAGGGGAAPRPAASVSRKCAPWRSGRAGFGALRGRVFWRPRRSASHPPPRQGQSAQAGLRAVQIVAPRSNSACAKSPGRSRAAASAMKPCASASRRGRGAGQRLLDRAQPRHDALHIGVQRHDRLVERDGGDRGGGVGADAGQRPQPLRVARKVAAGRHDGAGAGVQVACARVIAEAGPLLHHRRFRRRGERPHVRETFAGSAGSAARPPPPWSAGA